MMEERERHIRRRFWLCRIAKGRSENDVPYHEVTVENQCLIPFIEQMNSQGQRVVVYGQTNEGG